MKVRKFNRKRKKAIKGNINKRIAALGNWGSISSEGMCRMYFRNISSKMREL